MLTVMKLQQHIFDDMALNHLFLLTLYIVGGECNSKETKYTKDPTFANIICPDDQIEFQKVTRSAVACVTTCARTPGCTSLVYLYDNKTCFGIKSYNPFITSSPLPGAVFYRPKYSDYEEYLVSGPNGVDDSQLSASSNYYQIRPNCVIPDCFAAYYGRLSATGWATGVWIPSVQDTQQWIQVAFNERKLVSGIVLKGREPLDSRNQYVSSFKVIFSTDCLTWTTTTDQAGSAMVFEGTSGADVTVTRHLSSPVVARCVRVNPIMWVGPEIALRFDVLGCFI